MTYDQWKEQGMDAGLDGTDYQDEPDESDYVPDMPFRTIIEHAMNDAYYDHSRDTEDHVHRRYDLICQWCERRY